MKKIYIATLALAAAAFATHAKVANMALEFASAGTVDCGAMAKIDNLESFTAQMWLNPAEWNTGATLLQCGDLKISLATPGSIEVQGGGAALTVTSAAFTVGNWAQLTVVSDNGAATAYVNGQAVANGNLGTITTGEADKLTLGGGYAGRLDEVRLWNIPVGDKYNRFTFVTLNEWVPNCENLLVYYKMDYAQEKALVNYADIWSGNDGLNNHGVMSEGVSRVSAADNTSLPYLVNGAYTANERFWDRAIPREQYLVSNDLIILGIEGTTDGHLEYVTPNDHATLTNADYVASFEGRDGVMRFNGAGASMAAPRTAFIPVTDGSANWTFHTWLYIEEWVEGAYIFRQETADGLQGLSIRLGDPTNRYVIARVNGMDFISQKKMKAGQWMHFGLSANAATSGPVQSLLFFYNGVGSYANAQPYPTAIDFTPLGAENEPVYFGENFKGYFDETATWKRTYSASEIKNYSTNMPMPGIGKTVTADILFKALAYYTFDNPSNPGYDNYSQDEWLAIMKSAYDGYYGYQTTISVKSHDGWQTTINNANRRKIFAEDLARLSEPYDAVELDLEWIYGAQTTLGLLAEEIRKALPADKHFYVSCHNVAYGFPLDKMQYVDGFTFQQYGPQKSHSFYSHFTSMCQTFIDYGFPKEKIIGSYATTTSKGHKDGVAVTEIKGVRDGFLDGNFVDADDVDCGGVGGYNYYFTGPQQTFRRADYITRNNLGGIFYWDMGNDVPFTHEHNLSRHASYGLSANVDRIVSNVTPNHQAGIDNVLADNAPAEGALKVEMLNGNTAMLLTFSNGETAASAEIYATSGAKVMATGAASGTIDLSGLQQGVYVVVARSVNGTTGNAKILKY